MRVRATAVGFDGLLLRQPGDVFDMPDDTFKKRQRFENGVAGGKVIGEYPAPTWIVPFKGKEPKADGDAPGSADDLA